MTPRTSVPRERFPAVAREYVRSPSVTELGQSLAPPAVNWG